MLCQPCCHGGQRRRVHRQLNKGKRIRALPSESCTPPTSVHSPKRRRTGQKRRCFNLLIRRHGRRYAELAPTSTKGPDRGRSRPGAQQGHVPADPAPIPRTISGMPRPTAQHRPSPVVQRGHRSSQHRLGTQTGLGPGHKRHQPTQFVPR